MDYGIAVDEQLDSICSTVSRISALLGKTPQNNVFQLQLMDFASEWGTGMKASVTRCVLGLVAAVIQEVSSTGAPLPDARIQALVLHYMKNL